MPERMTVVVEGRDGLTVEDAMRQVLETFELIERSNPSRDHPIKWRLVNASMNSPLTVVAEAFASKLGFDPDVVAREQKKAFRYCFAELREGRVPDAWSATDTRNKAKTLIKRTANGIAQTNIMLDDGEPSVSVTATDLQFAVPALEAEPPSMRPSLQIGSVEGYLISAAKFYKKPAIVIEERRTGAEITCVIPQEFREEIGSSTTLDDIWRRRRVLVRGQIYYTAAGAIQRVVAETVAALPEDNIDTRSIKDRGFTDGMGAEEYLDRLRDGELG